MPHPAKNGGCKCEVSGLIRPGLGFVKAEVLDPYFIIGEKLILLLGVLPLWGVF